MIYAVTAPPSANEMWRHGNGRSFKTHAYKAWLVLAGTELNIQRARPSMGMVGITISVPANGRRDLDNFLKPTLDLLCRMHLIEDDRFKTVKRLTAEWHDQPAMLIEIKPYGPSLSAALERPRMATLDPQSAACMPL